MTSEKDLTLMENNQQMTLEPSQSLSMTGMGKKWAAWWS